MRIRSVAPVRQWSPRTRNLRSISNDMHHPVWLSCRPLTTSKGRARWSFSPRRGGLCRPAQKLPRCIRPRHPSAPRHRTRSGEAGGPVAASAEPGKPGPFRAFRQRRVQSCRKRNPAPPGSLHPPQLLTRSQGSAQTSESAAICRPRRGALAAASRRPAGVQEAARKPMSPARQLQGRLGALDPSRIASRRGKMHVQIVSLR
jgi:hypothetical protein